MNYFSSLPKDIVIKLALKFDLPTLLKFCQISKRINEVVCENKDFWYNKLIKDFGLNRVDIPPIDDFDTNNPKQVYQFLYNKSKDINRLLFWSVEIDWLKLVKWSLNNGAEIHTDNNKVL